MNVSRGNPRSSSVGEEKDVEEVRYRSTSKLDPSLIVEIEDCGIPLDCSSPGDSFKAQDPCENLHLEPYNVMGQEDLFRQENGTKVERAGVGRIVVTTIDETIIEKIEYERNPSDVNNPTFGSTWDVSNLPSAKRHEVFVPVDPDSLYAFRITVKVENCPDTVTSGIYYLQTGQDILVEDECWPFFEISSKITSQDLVYETTGTVECEIFSDLSNVYDCPINNPINTTQSAIDHNIQKTLDSGKYITRTISVT